MKNFLYKNKNIYSLNGFTLMELMIVVILIGMIAAFAIPNYEQAVRKSHARDARAQLMAIHAASTIFRAQNGAGTFWDPGAIETDVANINAGLNINIIENDKAWSYEYGAQGGDDFEALSTFDNFTLRVRGPDPLSTTTGSENPCCTSGPDCPSGIPTC